MNHTTTMTMQNDAAPTRPRQEFHILRTLRDALGMDRALFSISGTAVFSDLQAARQFAHDLEHHRIATGHPDPPVRAGEVIALGIMDEVLHHLLAVHRDSGTDGEADNVLSRAYAHVGRTVGADRLEETIRGFCEAYPPAAVYRGEQTVGEYLEDRVDGLSGRERTLEEMVLLGLTNENPAASRYHELFDDQSLRETTAYSAVFAEIERFFEGVPAAGPSRDGDQTSVLELLRAPARSYPNSLEDQLRFVQDRWSAYAGRFLTRILRSMDVIREEEKVHADPGGGPPPAEVYHFDEAEAEQFSLDTEWMPGVIMMAKSTLVWLYQLSQRYGRAIQSLDQVPDEELDRLASSGFNALWLIGLWERSPASRRIKHLSGNPDAEASAYALYSYDIAQEIGGWNALETLRRRCSDRGIRLASDMVPNHTGIDSPWLHDHPDWYVHLDHPPFPSYSFTGENLSGRGDVGVYLEDHYFDRTDAAVAFKHVDAGGNARYVYHGNDGTSMPWNDTAQLNYLNPEVREQLVQTILHVARNFPVIRFDAAMTLAKRHFRRLWFPEPGSGGDIASRAEHGLPSEEFDRAMPKEFWREVVDRVAQEAPGTLLLAEAFWMMEGYFVRTLGMHRVYNSAFMNMLKREQNAEYREIIRNTVSFDPKILERFVNFMNNPDEETAVTQFGTGDKYFGVATLLATMPGLPMFGHGQIEGLAEKYGMEFRRPYWDETPDQDLVARHEHEIFPLLRRRELFASAQRFRLYDLVQANGSTNEHVFAYSNEHAGDRAIVVYNNSYDPAAGVVRTSTPYLDDGAQRTQDLAHALHLPNDESFVLFQEQRSGLWYVRPTSRLHDEGLHLSLDGYQANIYWKVHVREYTSELAALEQELAGRGVPDIDLAVAGLRVQPVREAFTMVASETLFAELSDAMQGFAPLGQRRFEQIRSDYAELLTQSIELSEGTGTVSRGLVTLERHLSTLIALPHRTGGRTESTRFKRALGHYYTGLRESQERRRAVAEWVLLVPLADELGAEQVLSWGVETWAHQKQPGPDESQQSLREVRRPQLDRSRLLRTLLRRSDWAIQPVESGVLLRELLAESDTLELIGFNTHAGVEFYHLESLTELIWSLFAIGMLRLLSTAPLGGRTVTKQVETAHGVIREIAEANERAHGRAALLLTHLPTDGARPPGGQSGAG